jgi:hypothetical protein
VQPEFVSAAQSKNPRGLFVCADMTSFDLDRQYDVVLCLFSSIGYVKTLDNVRRTLQQFSKHVKPDGVVLVEPWFTPAQWNTGRVHMICAEREDVKVSRLSRSTVRGNISVIDFQYLIGRPDRIEHRSEVHELGLFTTEEMIDSFQQSGFDVRFDETGLTGRGLYIGRLRSHT